MTSEKGIRDPMQGRVNEAMRLARTVAGDDDARFVRTVHAVINAVDDVEVRAAAEESTRRTKPRGPGARAAVETGGEQMAASIGIPADSVFSDPVFLANAQWMFRARGRIVGGVPIHEFPDCVAVGSATRWCCTGTLVAPDVVVTAGHCFKPGCNDRVFVGTDVTRPGDGRVIGVRDRATHPSYKPPRRQDDIAVLLLKERVVDVAPRPIAKTSALGKARSVRVVGYGNTDIYGSTGYGIRRMVDVPLATNDPRFGGDPKSEFVAGAPFLDRDSCSGDSGGPAYVSSNGRWLLAGATSRATASSVRTCGDGGIYTLVPAYQDWLAKFLANEAKPRRRRSSRRAQPGG
jgi:hypothetical protein